jgi:hypothetical protein
MLILYIYIYIYIYIYSLYVSGIRRSSKSIDKLDNGLRRSSKSVEKFDNWRDDVVADDEHSVSSFEYYNTTTSIVRFAIDLDVNDVNKESDEEKWSWKDEQSEPQISSDVVDSKTNANKNPEQSQPIVTMSPPRTSRFSIIQFPTGPGAKPDILSDTRYLLNYISELQKHF